jgi:hypothetical protein
MTFNTDTRKYADAVQKAIDFVNELTPSVIALAKASGMTAKKFADVLSEADENSLYRISVASELQKIFVDSAVAEAKKKAEADKSNKNG